MLILVDVECQNCSSKHEDLLDSALFGSELCPECGGPMEVTTTKRNAHRWRYCDKTEAAE